MTSEEFVKNFYKERKILIDLFMNSTNNSDVSKLIGGMELNEKNSEVLRQILNGVLRDTFYTVLLGLEGASKIGGTQEIYKVEDENGNRLSGEIDSYAWEYFHNNKFEVDNLNADFIAILKYKTVEEGGRKIGAKSGYRPQVKFDFEEMQTSGQQTFIDRNIVFPGDTVEAEIKIISVDFFAGKLSENMKFEFREGEKVIGTGIIKHIVNEKLRIASR